MRDVLKAAVIAVIFGTFVYPDGAAAYFDPSESEESEALSDESGGEDFRASEKKKKKKKKKRASGKHKRKKHLRKNKKRRKSSDCDDERTEKKRSRKQAKARRSEDEEDSDRENEKEQSSDSDDKDEEGGDLDRIEDNDARKYKVVSHISLNTLKAQPIMELAKNIQKIKSAGMFSNKSGKLAAKNTAGRKVAKIAEGIDMTSDPHEVVPQINMNTPKAQLIVESVKSIPNIEFGRVFPNKSGKLAAKNTAGKKVAKIAEGIDMTSDPDKIVSKAQPITELVENIQKIKSADVFSNKSGKLTAKNAFGEKVAKIAAKSVPDDICMISDPEAVKPRQMRRKNPKENVQLRQELERYRQLYAKEANKSGDT
ncbi:MAG: hypothetical protein LBO73_02365 [Holosporaceae bacterium]|jgi:hypothetical protein|nr:hypothetical protein [Holosporaceae bacterium]